MTMPRTDKSFLQEKLNERGWRGGTPSTEEQENYILEYMDAYGYAPTSQEVDLWSAKDFNKQRYTPESTMGKMGWTGLTHAQALERGYGQLPSWSYGPGMGSLVPMGGLVVTEENRPFRRFMEESDPNASGYIEKGEFLPRRGLNVGQSKYDEAVNLGRLLGFEYPEGEFYPQPKIWQPLTLEEGLGRYSPETVYLSRAKDYASQLNQQEKNRLLSIRQEYDKLDEMKKAEEERLLEMVSKETLTEDEARAQMQGIEKTFNRSYDLLDRMYNELMPEYVTDTGGKSRRWKSEAMLEEIQKAFESGLTVDQMPYYSDIRDVIGGEIMGMYNKTLAAQQAQFRAAGPTPQWAPGAGQPQVTTGTEQRDYLEYIDGLGISIRDSEIMRGQFFDFLEIWRQTGPKEPFMYWLKKYLAGGPR